MQRTPREELQRRITSLQTILQAADVDGAIIIHNVNVYYFGGTVQKAYLFIPAEREALFFVGKNPDRVKNESLLEPVIALEGIGELRTRLAEFGYARLRKLGMELDVLPVRQYLRYADMFKGTEIVDIWPAIRQVRTFKSPYELQHIRQAAELSDYMIDVARECLREGIREIELAAEIERAARLRGHQGYIRMRGWNQEVYWGHLVSGPEAANPAFIDFATGGEGLSLALPSGAGWRAIRRYEPVMVDLCAGLNGYNVDQTRTLCLGGLPEKLTEAYNVSREIEEGLAGMIMPGTEAGALFGAAQQVAERHGLGKHFMGYGDWKTGFVGHGVGLELNEFPVFVENNRMPLAPGMVCALEPKFSFPDAGVVGVEDMYVVTETGSDKLTSGSYDIVVDKE